MPDRHGAWATAETAAADRWLRRHADIRLDIMERSNSLPSRTTFSESERDAGLEVEAEVRGYFADVSSGERSSDDLLAADAWDLERVVWIQLGGALLQEVAFGGSSS